MKKIIFILGIYFLISFFPESIKNYSSIFNNFYGENALAQDDNSDQILRQAFNNKKSDVQVQGKGIVIKILKDDLEGSKHQRFILKLNSGQTLLIAHNIDIAPRINNLKIGDTVSFFGEYEWNSQGGIIHWTHKDPQGNHIHGWLKHKGTIYQ